MNRAISILLIATFVCGEAAWAYEETQVSDGGTLLGSLIL